jgi:hypothetical protein
LSDVLSQQPVIAPEVTQEEPASTAGFSLSEPKKAGCWEVALASEGLSARWLATCDAPAVVLGPHHWREGIVRLPGAEGVEPLLSRAQAAAVLSDELAQRGEGALLFLPTTEAGAGYYVAAWSVTGERDATHADNDEPASTPARGYVLGRYGAAPVSVLTPAGRVYLHPDFAPGHALANNATQELEPSGPAQPASEPDESAGAGEPTT